VFNLLDFKLTHYPSFMRSSATHFFGTRPDLTKAMMDYVIEIIRDFVREK
jgi:hypothetical protein